MKYKSGMALIELTVVVAVIACLFLLFKSNWYPWASVDVDTSPSPEYQKTVETYKLKPASTVILNGKYIGNGVIDGHDVNVTYVFENGMKVKKVMEVKLWGKNFFQGEANYKQVGSTLVFTNISGDAFLFPAIGEPVVVEDQDSVLLVGSGNIRIKSEALAINQSSAEGQTK
ncbi:MULTISPECIES: hypothetical protein [Aeromonas]|uniref:hypothetical protein n=1 Tax=Aeromonas TaxID=642 RepID=UPI002B0626BD|nr:hypothetical protein [Aeromonas jandaei]